MNPEFPIIHDLVFMTAVDYLSNSYRRSIHEFTDMSASATMGERAKQQIDLLNDFFTQIKTDSTILRVKNAHDVQLLLETYFLNNDYKELIRLKTFELISAIGVQNIGHLATLFSHCYSMSDASTVSTISSPVDLANVLTNNPWLIMIIVSLFTRVTDTPGS